MNPEVDRRKFIVGVGGAVLIAQFLPLIARASGDEATDNLIIHSGPGFVPHTHDLLIPYAVLHAPPVQGVKLESTRALFHTHELVLTQEQLVLVSRGGTVEAIGGSHLFVIALAKEKS
jgi:hypothetical protein